MIRWGRRSKAHYDQLHPELRAVLDLVARHAPPELDFSIICSYRSAQEQQAAFDAGRSQKRPGESKHNRTPPEAFDFLPVSGEWKDVRQFARIAGMVQMAGAVLGIPVRWAGDSDRDGSTLDQRLGDWGHLELGR